MDIDPRLNEIDDCLYRVAARVLVVNNDRILLVKETDGDWWAIPGGGIDHGETIQSAVAREIQEELGVSPSNISSDYEIVYYNIGNVVDAVPRMNLYFKVTLPEDAIQKTSHVAEWKWLTRDEFLEQELHASFDKTALVDALFDDQTNEH